MAVQGMILNLDPYRMALAKFIVQLGISTGNTDGLPACRELMIARGMDFKYILNY